MRYDLIFLRDQWIRALAELTVGSRQMAWGKISRSYFGNRCELIVRQLRYATNPPDGSNWTPNDDWVLFDSPIQHSSEHVQQRIAQSHLLRGQLMAFLQVGLGENLDRWLGAFVENENTFPISSIRLVGPGMMCIRRLAKSVVGNHHTDQDTDQPVRLKSKSTQELKSTKSLPYSRLIGAMGEDLFAKYRNTPVVIFGAGRLGSLMAESMIRIGLRKLTIVDWDRLERLNLDGTFGSRRRDVGKQK